MFSYHSLIKHLMLLFSEKIKNNWAIWNVSRMFGKVDCKVSNHIEGVILSIQVIKVLLIFAKQTTKKWEWEVEVVMGQNIAP